MEPNTISDAIFHRTELLVGKENMAKLHQARIMILGLGGVGSWCAESLVRTGVMHLTIVDSDVVCVTNVNRQLQATSGNVGASKVEELRRRFLEISPAAQVVARQEIYSAETAQHFSFSDFDYVIDAIDSLQNKIHLIEEVQKSSAKFYSSMGAASLLDPTRIRVAKLSDSTNCPLARRIRAILRDKGVSQDFICVYSYEQGRKASGKSYCGTGKCMCPRFKKNADGSKTELNEWCSKKAVINGSVAHMTALFGFTLAGLVVNDIISDIRPNIKSGVSK